MSLSILYQFILQLKTLDEISYVSATVDPTLEIAAITNKICKRSDGGKALLFEKIKGSDFQLATNLFGSDRRVCLALGVTKLDELSSRLTALLNQIAEPDIALLSRKVSELPDFMRFAPHFFHSPDKALLNMDPSELTKFPFLQSWSGDGAVSGFGRYITLPQVFSVDPDGCTPNCGVYRVQLRGKRKVAIQWKKGSGGARHAELYKKLGKEMPVAIVLGGDPALLFSAMFPLPGDLDEVTFAGFMRGATLKTTECRTVPLKIPSGAEVVIEGYIKPGESVIEGPFGNHTGYYSAAAPAPLMRVTAISHRHNPIIPATVVGSPPMEDCWMSKAWERLLLAFLQKLIPSITDIHFPFESVFHQSAIISLENIHSGMVRNIVKELWGMPWFASAKILLFVNADSKIKDLSHAFWKTVNVSNFSKDIIHDKNSSRIAIDATGCHITEGEIASSAEISSMIAGRWKEYGLA